MQEVNSTYREIFDSGDYISEAYVVINGVTYQQSKLYSMCTRKKLFKEKLKRILVLSLEQSKKPHLPIFHGLIKKEIKSH